MAEQIQRFDGYEISPVVESAEPSSDGRKHCDFYFSESEAKVAIERDGGRLLWTLYGHLDGEGVESIGDFDTESDALTSLFRITGIQGKPGDRIFPLPATPPIPQSTSIQIIQGGVIPGREDGAICAVVISPEDIVNALSDADGNPSITLDQAKDYLDQYGDDVTDALLAGDWTESIRSISSLEGFVEELG